MEKIVKHSGVVTAVNKGCVSVKMRVVSACASCEAHSRCGFAEAKDKTVDVDTRDWKSYSPGDSVTVSIQTGNGLKAVFIAYVLPALVLIGAFVLFNSLHLNEGVTALLTLSVVGIYGVALYCIRHRLQQKFTFRISKPTPEL